MIIKVIPTLRYGGDTVDFETMYFEAEFVNHHVEYVSKESREKLVLNDGDVWARCAQPTESKEEESNCAATNPFRETHLWIQHNGKTRRVYVTGCYAIYLMNNEGKTVDTIAQT